jgi:hypothetical protein
VQTSTRPSAISAQSPLTAQSLPAGLVLQHDHDREAGRRDSRDRDGPRLDQRRVEDMARDQVGGEGADAGRESRGH